MLFSNFIYILGLLSLIDYYTSGELIFMADNKDILKAFSDEEEKIVREAYDKLLNAYLNSNHRRKTDIINKAFELAHKAHYGVRRRSGEPYILHPIAVADIICQEIGLGSTSICCALLHDVVEDTDYTVEDIREMFGDKIAQIVDGLTKISGGTFNSSTSIQAENFRKLILTMNDDVRVILIKIADRLHNMRTLDSMLPAKQYKIAGETLYVYAPLAHRLGLFAIKSELEDLSFSYEHPEVYRSIKTKIYESEEKRKNLFESFTSPLIEKFEKMGLRYEMKYRLKSIYSIWSKMEKKNIPFEEIYDIYAVRIIFESEENISDKIRSWEIYTAITDIYKNRPDRIRDWISNPKSNGYQALHLTVMGPNGNWVEVQIRSRKMDDIAEKGFAAHWKYKVEGVEEDNELEKWLLTIREILENPTPNAMDFLDTIKLNLYSSDIMVFTPKGDSMNMPTGSTVLDFAYTIHHELGDHCIGAKVNHRIVASNHVLSSGDQVEILTSQKTRPSAEWLDFTVTAKAHSLIDKAIRKQNRAYIKEGEEVVKTLLEANGYQPNFALYDRVARFYGFDKREEFFLGVGNSSVNLSEDLEKILNEGNAKPGFFTRMISSVFSLNNGNKNDNAAQNEKSFENKNKIDKKKAYELKAVNLKPNYKIASCCKPVAGEDVLGFILDDNTVEVHRRSCEKATRLKSSMGDRLLSTFWGDTSSESFEVSLSLSGEDNPGVLMAISSALANDFKMSLTNINLSSDNGIFSGKMTLLVHHISDVNKLCQHLQKSKAVLNIKREL